MWWRIAAAYAGTVPPADPPDVVFGTDEYAIGAPFVPQDGSWVGVYESDRSLVLRDLDTRRERLRLEAGAGAHFGPVAPSPDGAWLLLTEWTQPVGFRGLIRLVDARSGEERATLPLVGLTAVAPDGSGAVVLDPLSGHATWIRSTGESAEVPAFVSAVRLALSPGSASIAVATEAREHEDRVVTLVDTATGAVTPVPALTGAMDLAFAADGRLGAVTAGDRLVVWEPGRERPVLRRRIDPPLDRLWFGPDGTVYTLGEDDAVIGWGPDGRKVGPYVAPGALEPERLGFPSGKLVAAAPTGVAVWDASTRAVVDLSAALRADEIAFSQDGTELHTAYRGRHHEVHTFADGQRRSVDGAIRCARLLADAAEARDCARVYARLHAADRRVDPDEVQPIGHHRYFVPRDDGFLIVGVTTTDTPYPGLSNAWAAPNGRFALIELRDKGVELLDLQTGRSTRSSCRSIDAVRWSDDASVVVVATARGLSVLHTDAPEHELLLQRNRRFAVSPDGAWVAASSPGGIEVFDSRTGQLAQSLSHGGVSNSLGALAFSPDGEKLVSANCCTVRVHTLAPRPLP